jgi:hypothetical protein
MINPVTFFSLFVIILLSFSATPNFSLIHYISGEEDHSIPSWLIHLERWDVQGKISNSEYTQAIEYTLKQGFLQRDTAEELVEMVKPDLTLDADDKCWDRNFPKVNWSGCDFSGMNLNHADLADANLVGTNFANANLEKADLVEANLANSNLSHADITNMDLAEANLAGANMEYVNGPFLGTHYANLANADLTGANLHDSSLNYSNMTGVILKDSNLYHAELYGVNLSGADLTGANLSNADLNGANLTGAKLHCLGNPVCN